MNEQIDKLFGGRVRVRVCGLCWAEDNLLMVNHKGLTNGDFWAPPGGGVDFGFTIYQTLVHEFQDETGLTIEPGKFRFIGEFINEPLHAVELFFDVVHISGELKEGFDPELPEYSQILSGNRFMSFREIMNLKRHERHGLFEIFQTPGALRNASGYHKI